MVMSIIDAPALIGGAHQSLITVDISGVRMMVSVDEIERVTGEKYLLLIKSGDGDPKN